MLRLVAARAGHVLANGLLSLFAQLLVGRRHDLSLLRKIIVVDIPNLAQSQRHQGSDKSFAIKGVTVFSRNFQATSV